MGLLEIANAWGSDEAADLFKKFLGSCLKSAAAIQNEAAGTANHANRLIWAAAVMNHDTTAVYARVRQIIRYGAATNATMQANPATLSDNDIDFIVASSIDVFAKGS